VREVALNGMADGNDRGRSFLRGRGIRAATAASQCQRGCQHRGENRGLANHARLHATAMPRDCVRSAANGLPILSYRMIVIERFFENLAMSDFSSFPTARPRRLRYNPLVREL